MDVLAIGAHPDDCELFMGATLAKLVGLGYKVAIADLTRGERSSRGSPDIRRREAERAAKILGVAERIGLDLGDTQVGLKPDHREQVVRLLRSVRPSIVFSHDADDRNPDHRRASKLVREACFYSYVERFETGQERFRPRALVEFIGNPTEPVAGRLLVVPVGETFERKMEALRAYESQFHNPQSDGPPTLISSKAYFEQIEARGRYWGSLVGEKYGEVFRYRGLVVVDDPVGFLLAQDRGLEPGG